uniref:DNA polymerase n=1 Tax=Gull adenovirus TaxID=1306817 RepID=M4SSA5_9ADEN|nr:polymerase [Gull adenovirus]
MLITRDLTDAWTWISSRAPVRKCLSCGRYWNTGHSCNELRSAFYFHAVQKNGRDMWQHVPFRCPAQPANLRQLFVTYDIETYTQHEARGKRMHPFLLCFALSGDDALASEARRLALQDETLRETGGGYYWLDFEPGAVARRFRAFRTRLQQHFARDLVRRFAEHNGEFCQQTMRDGGYASPYDIPYELFEQPAQALTLPEDFYVVNVVVLGHNITKFDELLLATELVERRDIFPTAGKCTRTFMPRVGRLLFNDVHFAMPNPLYLRRDPTRTQRWARGIVLPSDARHVAVRFLVRDTLQLTSGAKLKKAAAAYALELAKGECPYEAVNDMVALGSFESDADGFPVARYWESEAVRREQKALWEQNHPGTPYDLTRACLEYCMLDVKVTEELAVTLYRSYDTYYKRELGMRGDYNIFERPTIPSNTHAFWKQLAFTAFAEKNGAEADARGKRKGKRKDVPHNYVAMLYAPYRPMFTYIRQALRGGRCYPNVLGPYRERVYVFDICGMYASALTHPMPHGMPLDPAHSAKHVDELNAMLARERPLSYFDERVKPSILKIDAYPPPVDMLDPLPPLCSRRGGKLVWTNEALHEEVVTVLDVLTLHNRGWTVTVLHDEMNIVFPEWSTICADYVARNIAAKEKADKEKNEVMRSISKMLSNALYGAFATNMDTSRVVFEQDLTDRDRKEIYEGTQIVKHVTLLNDRSFSGVVVTPQSAPFSAERMRRHFDALGDHEDDEYDRSPEDTDEEEEEGEVDARVADRSPDPYDVIKGERKRTETALTEDEPLPLTEVDLDLEEALRDPALLYPSDDHAHYASANETRFKSMVLLDAAPEALTVLHLEKLDQLVENKRYATQIACFVLGWSRAVRCGWCEILHGPDRGVHQHDRQPQSLYGDTDSMFVTESGYRRMKERGAHRIKGPQTRLIYDEKRPALYWACECDVKCERCKADAYASESVFLAPKLYGLRDAVCTNPECGHVGPGKIRSKGHRQAELIYDTLLKCWQRYEDQLYAGFSDLPELHTSRTIFKTTLLNKVSRYEPFTIHTEPLTRVLRPWRDPTLYAHGGFLYPCDTAHPNPRTAHERRRVPDIGHEDPLAPLDIDPLSFLSVEECDCLLDSIGESCGEPDEAKEEPEAGSRRR